jgi:hypothetical protein
MTRADPQTEHPSWRKHQQPSSRTKPRTSLRRTGSTSRPSGRYAVGLRPSPDTDPYLDAPVSRRRDEKTTPATLLTGPAPSGMTCENSPIQTLKRNDHAGYRWSLVVAG